MAAGDGVRDAIGASDAAQFAITPRPRSLLYTLMGVIVVESAAVHALIYKRWPMASVVLLVLNVWAVWWLWRESSTGSFVIVTPDTLEVKAGRSIRLLVPRASVRSARIPEWRELPEAGAKGYLRIAGGDDPNVLISFETLSIAHLPFGMKRPVATLGVHLAEPKRLVALLGAPSDDSSSQAVIHS